MGGWLAKVRRSLDRQALAQAYADFQDELDAIGRWNILPWTEDAADCFERLRRTRVRIGTMDLRIAAVAIAFDATLLTRNLADFRQVPGLRLENWLD